MNRSDPRRWVNCSSARAGGTGRRHPVRCDRSWTGSQAAGWMRCIDFGWIYRRSTPRRCQLGRVGDDLIIGVGGMRRRVRLASVLRRCIVIGAQLRGSELTVRFRPNPEVWPRLSGAHSDLGPELKQLARSILDRLDPAVRVAAARAQAGSNNPGRCQQVWCPVCARRRADLGGAASAAVNVVAEHSVALLTLVKAMVDNIDSTAAHAPAGPDGPSPDPAPPAPDGPGGRRRAAPPPGRYEHIPVSVDE